MFLNANIVIDAPVNKLVTAELSQILIIGKRIVDSDTVLKCFIAGSSLITRRISDNKK